MQIVGGIMGITGSFVEECVGRVKQPEGGYIPLRMFEVDPRGEGVDMLNPQESVRSMLIDSVVDHMTRFMLGTSAEEAFDASMTGAVLIWDQFEAGRLMAGIKGLDDDKSIINAVKLSAFDVCVRFGVAGLALVGGANPDGATIQNVRKMVKRSLDFFNTRGYVDNVRTGYGDFMTVDTLWDLEVLKGHPTKYDTFRLLMNWRMGLHPPDVELFQSIEYIGIYNPRLNEAYRISVDDIPDDAIAAVEKCLW